MGAERKSQFIEEKAKLLTAYHEVHIVVKTTIVIILDTFFASRVGTLSWHYTPTGPTHFIRLHVFLEDTRLVMYVKTSI